jgi:hypothetical protein
MSRSDTDLAWLSCAIAWMNADIIALQEIRDTAEAKQAWESVLDGLEAYTGSEWAVDLQDCGALSVQHVGFLWNTDRLTLSDADDRCHREKAISGAAFSKVSFSSKKAHRLDVKVNVPNDAVKGSVYYLHIAQSISGMLIGGYTAVVMVV